MERSLVTMMSSFEGYGNKEHGDKQVPSCDGDGRLIPALSRSSVNCYMSLLGSPYNQQAITSNTNALPLSSQYSLAYPSHASLRHRRQSTQATLQPQPTGSPGYPPLHHLFSESEIESQDSPNEGTTLSEPVIPALDGFPDVQEFDRLMNRCAN